MLKPFFYECCTFKITYEQVKFNFTVIFYSIQLPTVVPCIFEPRFCVIFTPHHTDITVDVFHPSLFASSL